MKRNKEHLSKLSGEQGGELQWQAQLEDRVQELLHALRPFARMANAMDAAPHGNTVVLISGESDGRFGQMPIAKFRTARKVLGGK